MRFATGKVEVHVADDWERKGPWEQMALDSRRFQQRIQETDRGNWLYIYSTTPPKYCTKVKVVQRKQ